MVSGTECEEVWPVTQWASDSVLSADPTDLP